MDTATKTKHKEIEVGEIPIDWETKTIDDIAEIIGGGTPKTSESEYWGGDIPWLSVVDFGKGNRHVYHTEKAITKLGLENSSTKVLDKGMLIISARGTVGEIAQLGRPMAFNQSCYGLNAKACTSNDFLYYLLKQSVNDFKQKSHGAVFDTITRDTFRNINVSLPSAQEQKQIAEILSSLDDKIELNRQINANLERLASALFKHWFVDENESRDQWELKPLDKVADFLNGLALQKYPAVDTEDYLPVIKIRELKSGISDSTDKASTNIPTEYILKDGDVVFSWSGSLEVVIWCDGRGALNQHLFKVTSDRYEKWFYYLWIKNHLPSFQNIASDKAVTMGHIKRGHLSEAMVLIPDDEALQEMNATMSPIIDLIKSNSVENRRLATLRDLLLPRLMSGKIRTKAL